MKLAWFRVTGRHRYATAGDAGPPLPPPSLVTESTTPAHCPYRGPQRRVSTLTVLATAPLFADLHHGGCWLEEESGPVHITLQ